MGFGAPYRDWPMKLRVLVRRVLLGKRAVPADLITGIVGPEAEGDWCVFWAGDGASPSTVRALSMTQVIDEAASEVAALYARHPQVSGAELQFAIYPWNYRGGPIFDITARPGLFTAHDKLGSDQEFQAATLEDLIVAVEKTRGVGAEDSMFRWVRPIASLPLPTR
jgi:hypothetical protein